jgi:hypothetical protein
MITVSTPTWIELEMLGEGWLRVHHLTKGAYVDIDATAMDDDEVERACTAAVTILERQPVNRKQRRALKPD